MGLTLTPLYHSTLGFDRIFNEVERLLHNEKQSPTYPPHNIVKVSNNQYFVELALAGFNKNDIDISVIEDRLIITGEKKNKDDNVNNYIYQGIALRNFTKTLKIAETILVRDAEFKDGILRICLENIVPENKKPRKIQILDQLNTQLPQKQLLSE